MREEFLDRQIAERVHESAFRSLRISGLQSDFCSNDYLGIVKNGLIEQGLYGTSYAHGSTGSRLLAGNNSLTETVESEIAEFHQAPAALIFNSGYDANFGLLACIARRGDQVFYDKLSHASIRDGIRQSFADSRSFAHNDLNDLESKLRNRRGTGFVITESVFSMDGDKAPLAEMLAICERYGANLIVDEAHATGIIGMRGEGLLQDLRLHDRCFARIHTFGKALGCHGAVILGSNKLRQYLINFCRPFIYSTALPPASIAAIQYAYRICPDLKQERASLQKLISLFDCSGFKKSETPIQCFIVPGNENVKKRSEHLLKNNLDVRPILYPTVPQGEERLRIALHSFNTEEEVRHLINLLLTPL